MLRALLYATMLEVGTEEVNIQVTEKIDGCVPQGENESELIFNSLLRKLSHSDYRRAYLQSP